MRLPGDTSLPRAGPRRRRLTRTPKGREDAGDLTDRLMTEQSITAGPLPDGRVDGRRDGGGRLLVKGVLDGEQAEAVARHTRRGSASDALAVRLR